MIFHYMAVNPTALFRFSYFGSIYSPRAVSLSRYLYANQSIRNQMRHVMQRTMTSKHSFVSPSFSTFFYFTVGLKKNHSSTILRNYLENCAIFKTDHRVYLFHHSLSFFFTVALVYFTSFH